MPVNISSALASDNDYDGFKKFKQRTIETYYDRIADLSAGDRYYY